MQTSSVAQCELCTTIYAGTSISLIPRAERLKALQAKPSASGNYR